MTRLSATEVAREFSAVVNRIGAGEEIEVVCNGVPVVAARRLACRAAHGRPDTSVLVDAERRGRSLERAIDDEERAISVITASELLHGVHRAQLAAVRTRRTALVEHLISAIEPLPINIAIARVHAEIWAGLESRGELIGASRGAGRRCSQGAILRFSLAPRPGVFSCNGS